MIATDQRSFLGDSRRLVVTVADVHADSDLLLVGNILSPFAGVVKWLLVGRTRDAAYAERVGDMMDKAPFPCLRLDRVGDEVLAGAFAGLATDKRSDPSAAIVRCLGCGVPVFSRVVRNSWRVVRQGKTGWLWDRWEWCCSHLGGALSRPGLLREMRGACFSDAERAKGELRWVAKPIAARTGGIRVFIISRNNGGNVDSLHDELSREFRVEVLDNDSDPGLRPGCVTKTIPNSFWTGSWNAAAETWGDDVLWGVTDDVSLLSSAAAYRDALESSLPFGLWSPAVTGVAHSWMSGGEPGARYRVRNLEGIALAASRPVLEEAHPLCEDNYLGSGQDFWMSYVSRQADLRNVLDARVQVCHRPAEARHREREKRQIGYRQRCEEQMGRMFMRLLGERWPLEVGLCDTAFDSNVEATIE